MHFRKVVLNQKLDISDGIGEFFVYKIEMN